MGKASRNKAARAAPQRASRPVARQLTPEQELSCAVIVVGEIFGIEPDCASAAGLLANVGSILGYELRPRPVSVIIVDRPTGTVLTMGPRATEKLSPEQLAKIENHRPEGKDNGHMVLTSETHNLLLDPNMRQLGSWGVQAPSIIIRIRSAQPASGEWVFSFDGLDLLYFLDDDNPVLLPLFEETLRDDHVVSIARTIAAGIRSGISVDEIVARARQG